ncbi:hypothetical protein AGMMS49938_00030 [Fibrobacterales bacterium]|nr:hypothetical protein AGMMS49938_00030 [Fibrobacterales bacterium]
MYRLALTSLFIIAFAAQAAFSAQKNILILNSYEQGFAWSDDINKGIWNIFIDSVNINVHILHMNIPTEQMFPSFTGDNSNALLRLSKIKIKFDVIITVDEAAFDFAQKYRNELWNGAPIVSCGINESNLKSLTKKDSLWTGIVEDYNIKGMIDFIKTAQPNVKRIAFVTDRTRFGTYIKNLITDYKNDDPDINIEEWESPAWESLPKFLRYLDTQRDAIVLAGVNFNDSIRSTQKLWKITTEYTNKNSRAPVYTFWNSGVKNGILGGDVIFASVMGENTGKIALAILEGKETGKKNFWDFRKTSNQTVLDEQATIQRNLNPNNFSIETIRLNKSDSWLSKYQKYVSDMQNVVVAQSAIILIICLIFYAYYRFSYRRLLREADQTKNASRAKSTFLANMSHEIRNPLNSILGFSELLLSKNKGEGYNALTDEQSEWVSNIRLSSYLLRDTLNNILDYSKLEVGKIKFEEAEVDIFDLCDELISVCRHYLLYKNNVRLYVMPSLELPRFVIVDAVRLKQVLVNLISNALKFTNSGSVRLEVKPIAFKSAAENNGVNQTTVLFEIIDTGVGISADGLKKIFKPFEQIYSGETRKYNGAGLGLTIANEILANMHSKLTVKSKVGWGSNFHFSLKLESQNSVTYLSEYVFMKSQRVTIYSVDINVLKYLKEAFFAVNAICNDINNEELIFSATDQNLLMAEADSFSDYDFLRIEKIYPRVILFFYEGWKIKQVRAAHPNFEYFSTPVQSGGILSAVSRLYSKNPV